MSHSSEQSRINIVQALHRAAKNCLVRDPADTCVIADSRPLLPPATAAEKLIVVTISSFKFRLLVIFHFDEAAAPREYFLGADAKRSMEEVFYEISNMCCGALNRDILCDFQHLAMSVPYTLAGACMTHISELRPEYISSSIVTINDSVRVRLTLCLCCSAPVAFSATSAASQTESGALELF
jgi:hypothetical protein